MSPNDQKVAEQPPPTTIKQRGGCFTMLFGQVFGDVVFQLQLLTPKTAIAIIAAVAMVAAMAGIVLVYVYNAAQKPARMTGGFNIAVAQFGEVTDQGIAPSARATEIGKLLFDFLDSEYKATDFGLKIQVAHEKIGILTEDQEAEQLASDINADIVIYGNIFADGNEATLSPRFYIADRPDTGELTGQHQLALPLQFEASSLSFPDSVNAELRTRAAILVLFTEGLSYLSSDDLDGASHSFQQAIHEAESHGPYEGQEVLYLFATVTNERQGNIEQAVKHLDEAFRLNPEYARAYLARGNLYYAQALRKLNDEGLLKQALAEYEKAIKAQDQPAGAYILEKADVALGNVYVLRAQETGDPGLYAQAIDRYERVVTRYGEPANERIRELAARAYFGIGIAYERQNDYIQAKSAYQQCADITRESQTKSRCELQLDIIAGET
jgi:tetratricopeptide (TPR) repeat protein